MKVEMSEKQFGLLFFLALILIIAIGLTTHGTVHGTQYVQVNKTMCLREDALDRIYDKKGDCFIKLTEGNIDDFCKIKKKQDPQWCDQSVMSDLLRERMNK
jgi:hypothetical protein